jgi:hypothetical protein
MATIGLRFSAQVRLLRRWLVGGGGDEAGARAGEHPHPFGLAEHFGKQVRAAQEGVDGQQEAAAGD